MPEVLIFSELSKEICMSEEVQAKTPLNIPLSRLKPIKANKVTAENGFLWPLRSNLGSMLMVDWEGSQYALYLSDPGTMKFFPIKPDISLRGFMVDECDFVVDVTSGYDAVQKEDPLGAIVLKNGAAFISAKSLDQFSEPVLMPIWGEYDAGTEDEAIGFTRWSLVIHDEDRIIELWKHEGADAK
jgi:hypothetical protein